jgi:hypothetical protein
MGVSVGTASATLTVARGRLAELLVGYQIAEVGK